MNIQNNWSLTWSKWANKSRQEVIEMTNHLKSLGELERKIKQMNKDKMIKKKQRDNVSKK